MFAGGCIRAWGMWFGEGVKGRGGNGGKEGPRERANEGGSDGGMEGWEKYFADGGTIIKKSKKMTDKKEKIWIGLGGILGVIMVAFYSCDTVKEISIEVLSPAEVTIPPDIQSVTFVNRSYAPWMAKDREDTLRRPVDELFILDTLIGNKFFLGVLDALNSSPLFNIDELNIIQLRRNDPARFPDPLSDMELVSAADTIKSDAIICLEGYRIKDTLAMDDNWGSYYYDEEENAVMIDDIVFSVEGTMQWRVYDVLSPSIIDEFISTDTLEWITGGDFIPQALSELPEVVDGYREYAYQRGYYFGMRISPIWWQVRRFYFIRGNKYLRKAADYANIGKWEEAAEIWKKESDSDDKKIAAKSAFNLALYSERKDLLVPAIDWATKSYGIINEKYTKTYINILEQRKLNKLKLEQQIPIK
jgi:hypothetical protein